MIKLEKIGICKDCHYAEIKITNTVDGPLAKCVHEEACDRVEEKTREEVIAKYV